MVLEAAMITHWRGYIDLVHAKYRLNFLSITLRNLRTAIPSLPGTMGLMIKLAKKLLLVLGLAGAVAAHADDSVDGIAEGSAKGLSNVQMGKDYALGIGRFDLDTHTEILGWQISDSWYFGRQDGLDSGLTLVWQSSANQVSFSKDGLRLTRRF